MEYKSIVNLIKDVKFVEKTSYENWLKEREKGIGGSDAGAIMEMNKYSSPLAVYLSKKGTSSFTGNAATEWGNILEAPIRKKASEELDVEILEIPGTFFSLKNSFMLANVDGLIYLQEEKEINGTKLKGVIGHEIKTSKNGDGFSIDEIPDSYYCQVQHYMATLGLEYFILTAFIFDKYKINHYIIKRNDDFIKELILSEKKFWQENILKDIPPEPNGNENEANLVKSLKTDENITLPEYFASIIEEKSIIDEKIKELTKKSEIIKEKIILEMARASSSSCDKTIASCGEWKITYSNQESRTVDSERLKKDGLYENYVKKNSFRVFRMKKESFN